MPGRVLMLVENLSVPFDRRVWNESRALARAGYDVTVICPRGHGTDGEPYAEVDGIRIHRFPPRWSSGGGGVRASFLSLRFSHGADRNRRPEELSQ